MNRENLKKLADGLRGPLRIGFEMREWVSGNDGFYSGDIAAVSNECGTAACACGHATYLVEPKLPGETFYLYAARVFGLCAFDGTEAFEWCFGSEWTFTDNTPAGAADRIDWMLSHGTPDNVGAQITGAATLCYRSAA